MRFRIQGSCFQISSGPPYPRDRYLGHNLRTLYEFISDVPSVSIKKEQQDSPGADTSITTETILQAIPEDPRNIVTGQVTEIGFFRNSHINSQSLSVSRKQDATYNSFVLWPALVALCRLGRLH